MNAEPAADTATPAALFTVIEVVLVFAVMRNDPLLAAVTKPVMVAVLPTRLPVVAPGKVPV